MMTDSESCASVKKFMLSAFPKACEILIGIKLNTIGCIFCYTCSVIVHDECVSCANYVAQWVFQILKHLSHPGSCECLALNRSAMV